MPDGHYFLHRGQCLFPPPQAGKDDGLVVQRYGELGLKRVGTSPSQLPMDPDGFLNRG